MIPEVRRWIGEDEIQGKRDEMAEEEGKAKTFLYSRDQLYSGSEIAANANTRS